MSFYHCGTRKFTQPKISLFPLTYRPSSTLSAAGQRRRHTSENAVRTGRASLSYCLFTRTVHCHCVSDNNDFIIIFLLLLLKWWFYTAYGIGSIARTVEPVNTTQPSLPTVFDVCCRFVISWGDNEVISVAAITVFLLNHDFVLQCPAATIETRPTIIAVLPPKSTSYYNLCFFSSTCCDFTEYIIMHNIILCTECFNCMLPALVISFF